ncbi:glycosyltransferase family 4 protein [Haloferula chungangensis]|uniref:Glycosyltransferase family 4 protein n=1 Tax=Haloferula chungangensis TaxID=1048331 RepID=A0ABW2L6T3_9BACT
MKSEKHLLLWERMGDYHRARWKATIRRVGSDACLAADLGTADGLYEWQGTEDDPNHFVLVRKPVGELGDLEAFMAFRRLVREQGVSHVAIPGYGRLAYMLMLVWSRLTGRRVTMFAESWYPGRKGMDWAKGLFLRGVTHRCFVSGVLARDHFVKRLGFPESAVFAGYSVVDNDHFAAGHASRKSNSPDFVRDEKGRRILLCVARFAEEKSLELLVAAFKQSKLSESWKLVLVGGGPLKDKLAEASVGAPIELRDWLDYDSLPDLYASASCFVLPSNFEPWGLVVNEAMAAGLPILLSDAVGGAPDLLRVGENGWSFPSGDESALRTKLDQLAESPPERLAEMGACSRQIIAGFSVDSWAEKLMS